MLKVDEFGIQTLEWFEIEACRRMRAIGNFYENRYFYLLFYCSDELRGFASAESHEGGGLFSSLFLV